MTRQYSRRSVLAAGSLAFAGCRAAPGEYFGQMKPSSGQRLMFEKEWEPGTLDPALWIDTRWRPS